MSQRAAISPEQYSELVRSTSDEDLANAMRVNREAILEQIFRAIPAELDADAADGMEWVIEWRITDLRGGAVDRWQLAVRDGECEAIRGGECDPSAVITVGPVAFLKLIAGAVPGPALFMSGELTIDGDLLAAAHAYGSFRFPGGDE